MKRNVIACALPVLVLVPLLRAQQVQVEEHVLPNGMKLLMVPRRGSPNVAAGWVAKVGPGRGKLSSFSIAKYGPQQSSDASYFADAGNGDQFAVLSPPVDRDDVFVWNHETDDRAWVAGNVEMYLRWWLTGKIKV